MVTYADSSFLVSLFIKDGNSALAKRYLVRNPGAVSVTRFSKCETEHAIRTLALKKQITLDEMARALFQFEHDEAEGFFRSEALEADTLFLKTAQLSNRHALEIGVRYLDTIHVASALLLNAAHFLTFDLRQRKLARAIGLDVRI
jgi:predicted nucleic acid-binding protein